MKPDMHRAARKKLLLLEGTLHRLEILEAKAALRSGAANSLVGQRLPGVLAFLFQHKAGAMLTSLLPLLVGAGRVSRIARRGTLLLGAGAALVGLVSRWQRARPPVEPLAQDDVDSVQNKNADEKNPGQDRD